MPKPAWQLSTLGPKGSPRISPDFEYAGESNMSAIGLIETKGLIGLVAATDTMLKAANVELVKRIGIGGGLVTVIVSGDVGSVRTAVETGAGVASQVGELVSSHVIANPAAGVVEIFLAEDTSFIESGDTVP